jgi:PAS domain S-box-containing protein
MKQQSKDVPEKGLKSKKDLNTFEESYQDLFNNNLAGTYRTTLDGKIIDCNDSFAKMLGYSSKVELLDLNATDLYFSQSDRNKFLTDLKQNIVLRANTCLLKRRDGSRCWILENTFLDKGNYIVGTVIDISERERVEESLLEAEEKYQLLVEMSPTCIVIHMNNKFAYVNDATVKFFKAKNKEELLGRPIFDFITPEYHTIVKQRIYKMQTEMKGVPVIEEKLICIDGSVASVEVAGVPIYYRGLPAYQIIFQDITERKKMRADIIKEELKYKEFIEMLPQPVFETDLDGNIQSTNECALSYFGISNEKLSEGINVFDFIVPTEREIAKNNYQSKLNDKTIPQIVYTLQRTDGTTFQAVIYSSVIFKNNEPVGLRGIILDITERNNIEEYERKRKDKIIWNQTALLDLNKIDKTDFKVASKKICEIDAQTLGVDFVSVWTRDSKNMDITCINQYDLQNDNHLQGNYIKVDENFAKKMFRIFQEEGLIAINDILNEPLVENFKDEKFLHPDVLSLLYIPIWSQDTITGIVCHECLQKREWTLEDINFTKSIADIISIVLLTVERKIAADQIRKNEAYYRAIVQDQTELIRRYLPDRTLTFVNDAYCRFLNLNKEELIGRKFTDFIPAEELGIIEENISGLNTNNPIVSYEHKLRLDNGEIRWHQWVDRLILCNEKGENLEFQAVGRDITLQKKMENELVISRKKIEESNRLKSIFLENMSHELRTPITGILGLTELLRDELENDMHKELADKVVNSTKRLMQALNLLITVSETESEKPELRKTEIDIVKTTKLVVEQFEKINSEKNLFLKFNGAKKKAIAYLDVGLFKLIIECLIDNAYKFTKKGGITIDINSEVKNEKEYCSIKISDTGIGIAKENLSIVFKEFKQLSEGFSRQFEGFGLGLTVAKRLTEMMGGIIEIDSELGIGTTISLYFEKNFK